MIDLMKLPGWSVIVRALHEDQGDLPVPEKFEIDQGELEATLCDATLDQLSTYVATLSEPDLVVWAVGDQDTDAYRRLVEEAGPLAQGLSCAVDELFMLIGG